MMDRVTSNTRKPYKMASPCIFVLVATARKLHFTWLCMYSAFDSIIVVCHQLRNCDNYINAHELFLLTVKFHMQFTITPLLSAHHIDIWVLCFCYDVGRSGDDDCCCCLDSFCFVFVFCAADDCLHQFSLWSLCTSHATRHTECDFTILKIIS